LFIPDPDPDFLPIPDPGVKKAPDPGSATLPLTNNQCGESESGLDPDSNGLANIFPKKVKIKKFHV
jgi:hypothetical protein